MIVIGYTVNHSQQADFTHIFHQKGFFTLIVSSTQA